MLASRFTDMADEPDDPAEWSLINTANLRFGTFGADSVLPWAAAGSARACYWGPAIGNSSEMRVRYRNLPIPPTGFTYEGFMVHMDPDREPESIGPVRAVPDENFVSLENVDIIMSNPDAERPSAWIRVPGPFYRGLILESVHRGCRPACEPGSSLSDRLEMYDEVLLVMRMKAAVADASPIRVMHGETTESIRDRRPATD
jgi:hypothetical protein